MHFEISDSTNTYILIICVNFSVFFKYISHTNMALITGIFNNVPNNEIQLIVGLQIQYII